MQTHVNPLKPLAALSLLLLLAAPLQQAHSLGTANVSGTPGGDGGTLRDTPDEEGQAAEEASQNQEAGDDASAEAPDEAEPEAASDESSEATDESVDSDDEDSTDESDDSEDEDSEDEDSNDEDE